MKYLSLVCFFIFFMTGMLFSHSASDIKAEFDKKNKIIKITIKHSVKDNSKHYINLVEVYLNDKKIISQTFNKQSDNLIQDVQYKIIDAGNSNKKDKIEIKTVCNLSGNYSKKFDF